MEFYFDSFDCQVQCEENPENDDWLDANVEDVLVDGIPLDGHYLEHLIDEIDF